MEGKTWLWIGLGVVVVLFLMKKGSSVTQLQSPDTSGETAARYSFAESGLAALASAFEANVTSTAQLEAERSRDNAYLESARIYGSTATAQAQSQERIAMSQYQTALAGNAAQVQGQVDIAKQQHKNDWLQPVVSVITSIIGLFG